MSAVVGFWVWTWGDIPCETFPGGLMCVENVFSENCLSRLPPVSLKARHPQSCPVL